MPPRLHRRAAVLGTSPTTSKRPRSMSPSITRTRPEWMPECICRTVAASAMAGAQPADGRMQFQRRFGRAAAVVLAGVEMAEQGQDAVALQPGDVAAMTRNHVTGQPPELLQQFRIFLRLEPLRVFRRARDIREQHGHVAPLPGGGPASLVVGGDGRFHAADSVTDSCPIAPPPPGLRVFRAPMREAPAPRRRAVTSARVNP